MRRWYYITDTNTENGRHMFRDALDTQLHSLTGLKATFFDSGIVSDKGGKQLSVQVEL